MTTNKKSSKKKYIKYHNDGTVWAKGTMVDGVPEGYWEWFRKEGTKMRSGYFKKGKQGGEWTTYDRKGRVVKVTNFSGPRAHREFESHPLRKLENGDIVIKTWIEWQRLVKTLKRHEISLA